MSAAIKTIQAFLISISCVSMVTASTPDEEKHDRTQSQSSRHMTTEDIRDALIKVKAKTLTVDDFTALLNSDPTLITLDVSDINRENKLGAKAVKALANALIQNQSITALNLDGNVIGDEGVRAIAETIKVNQCLKVLNLRCNKISDAGVKALTEAIHQRTTPLRIKLALNAIEAKGAKALAKTIKQSQCIQEIDLSFNQIGNKGAAYIAEAIKDSSALQTVDMRSNGITDEGAKHIAEALKSSASLTSLDLAHNKIGDEGMTLLAEGIKHCPSLTSVDLAYNVLNEQSHHILESLKQGRLIAICHESPPQITKDVTIKETDENKQTHSPEIQLSQTAETEINIEKIDEPKAPVLKPLYNPSAEEQKPLVTYGTPKAFEIKEEEKRPNEMSLTIPPVAKGYEEIYKQFLKGALIYRPQPGSNVGMIKLPIAALANPLEGTFDLSQCGNAGEYLSIATGYRKGRIAKNIVKIEIWLAPRFLIEKELKTTASHFKAIMSKWSEKAPVGIFWTWGSWDDLSKYDYLTTQNMDELSNNNLYEKWHAAPLNRAQALYKANVISEKYTFSNLQKISCSFSELK